MLIEPSCAPSMREKWTRSPWVSTTAMLSFQRCLVASASAAATSFFAVSRLTGVPYGISFGVPSAVPPAAGGAAGAACAGGCCAAAGKARTRAAVVNAAQMKSRMGLPPDCCSDEMVSSVIATGPGTCAEVPQRRCEKHTPLRGGLFRRCVGKVGDERGEHLRPRVGHRPAFHPRGAAVRDVESAQARRFGRRLAGADRPHEDIDGVLAIFVDQRGHRMAVQIV